LTVIIRWQIYLGEMKDAYETLPKPSTEERIYIEKIIGKYKKSNLALR